MNTISTQDDRSFKVTETLIFESGNVKIDVQNDSTRFAWRLVVDGEVGDWTTHYQGLLEFKGWYVATAYWAGVLPEMVPFRIEKASK